jgi:hypothetical protein
MAKSKNSKKARAKPAKKVVKKLKTAASAEKAGEMVAKTRRVGEGSEGKALTTAGGGDSSNTLPEPQINVSDLQVLRTLIEETGRQQLVEMQRLLQEDRDQRAAQAPVPLPPSPYDDNAMGRLLATTSEIRERSARIEVGMGEMQRRITLLEENQRPPAPAPDREVAARTAMGRWMLANQCRALNNTRPTPAIVGRVMNDERAFDQRSGKSPQELFLVILNTVRCVFRLAIPQPNQEAAAASEQDYVHLTEEIAAVIEGRSSIPKKKQSDFLKDELKPRLELLVNSGLAEVVPVRTGNRTNYSRFLTPMGGEVFDGWPEWADRTGGISLADEQTPPDLNAAGRPVIGATAPPESQSASPPPQPSARPPTSQPPTPPST